MICWRGRCRGGGESSRSSGESGRKGGESGRRRGRESGNVTQYVPMSAILS